MLTIPTTSSQSISAPAALTSVLPCPRRSRDPSAVPEMDIMVKQDPIHGIIVNKIVQKNLK
jgi:hypothetical protein